MNEKLKTTIKLIIQSILTTCILSVCTVLVVLGVNKLCNELLAGTTWAFIVLGILGYSFLTTIVYIIYKGWE